MARLEGFTLHARAKLNALLEVGGQQPDGLHAVRSVVADLALADELSFFAGGNSAFRVTAEGIDLPEAANLAWRAVAALRPELRGWHIHLRKHIPSQAGLGGGSADAAAALRGVARIMEESGVPVARAHLLEVAAVLGSDVPACLSPGIKIVRGTGAVVEPLGCDAPLEWAVVLLKPSEAISTADAYCLLDETRGEAALSEADISGQMKAALIARDFASFCALLHNDFQLVIEERYPAVRTARERLVAAGAPATLLCGSGSTVAGFFAGESDAQSALAKLEPASDGWSALTGFAGAG